MIDTSRTNERCGSADANKDWEVSRVRPASWIPGRPPPLGPLSINLRAPIWDVLLHLMWQQLAGGLLSLWADRRSTPLIPVHAGWMEKTEDSTAWGSNRAAAAAALRPLCSLCFIGEEGRGGEEGREGGKKRWGVSFPMRMLSGVRGAGFFSQGGSSMRSRRGVFLSFLQFFCLAPGQGDSQVKSSIVTLYTGETMTLLLHCILYWNHSKVPLI